VTLARPGIASQRCSTNSLGRPSPPLCSTVRRGRCQLRDTVPPTPVRLTRRALECLSFAYTGPCRDVRPTGSVIPVVVNPVRPSPPLPHHAGHCDDIPTLLGRAGTRRRHNGHCATHGSLVNGTLKSVHYGGQSTNRYTATLEATPVRAQDALRRLNPSRIRQDGRQLRDTTRHTSTRREIVRHACKLLPPWPIKRGAVPQPRGHGTTDSNHLHALRLLHDIGTCLNQYLWDLEARPPLPPRL
jgi:hypothetical protein